MKPQNVQAKVDENIHKASDVALFVADAFAEAGEGFFETFEQLTDGAAGGTHDFEIIGEFAEWSGDSDVGHGGFVDE